MKSVEVDRIIRGAGSRGRMSLEELDGILADDGTFEKNVDKLNDFSKSVFHVEIPYDQSVHGKARKGCRRRAPSQIGIGDLYYRYCAELPDRPAMTRHEERLFAKRMEFLKLRLTKIIQSSNLGRRKKKYGFLSNILLAFNRCRSLFVERSLHLVIQLVPAYRSYGVPLMDLVQEGNAAVIRAVEKFDWRKGVRLKTYADFWIRQAVERHINTNRRIVKVPLHINQRVRRFKREGKLSRDLSSVSIRQMSDVLEVSEGAARFIMASERSQVSLSSFDEDEDKNLEHLLVERSEEFHCQEEREILQRRIQEALDGLTDQEKTIIKHRFGIGGAVRKTLNELGGMMNISRERIRQIQNRSIQKMKKPALQKCLSAFY